LVLNLGKGLILIYQERINFHYWHFLILINHSFHSLIGSFQGWAKGTIPFGLTYYSLVIKVHYYQFPGFILKTIHYFPWGIGS